MVRRLKTNQRMSQAVIYGRGERVVLLSGQVADRRDGSTAEQTSDVLRKISDLLHEAGSRVEDVISATIWLSDIDDFDTMNAVWDGWVPTGHAPVRATVEARLAHPDYRVEIQVTALAVAAS